MTCSQCVGIESTFNVDMAARELKDYHKKGADRETRLLIDALVAKGVHELNLLDIGGGVGAIQHELFKSGLSAATDVDASSAYLKTAQEEAARQGNAERTTFRFGNFVDLAAEIEPADIVTLGRVICCYPDMQALVRLSAERARRFYAVIFPLDGWLMRLGGRIANFFMRLSRSQFRTYIHATADVEAIVEASGFTRQYYRRSGFIWQVIVYARA